jgi:predicted GNAT family acetyltransferase
MATLAELLRQGADKLVNLPSEAQRFITNPQAFTQLLTGKNPLPRETGFAAGATGLPAQEMSVLDPNQAPYMQGYSQGEPIGYAGMTLAPLALNRKQILSKQIDNLQDTALIKGSPLDVSSTFGKGAERIQYKDPTSEGFINVLVKPDGTASVLGLEVPEKFRGKGIGQKLQSQVLQDFPQMQGQVSSKAAAKNAYKLGRRPVGQPNATLDDVFKAIDEDSSINLVSPKMQESFSK